MNRGQILLALYQASNLLMGTTQALAAAGLGEAAAHTRQAGGDVLRAIAAIVRDREQECAQ